MGKEERVKGPREKKERKWAKQRGTDPRTPVMIHFKVVYMVYENYNEVTDRKQ